jgi:solute carrier family 25 (mitochondrial S-adenosylmethionine transporter), member 26
LILLAIPIFQPVRERFPEKSLDMNESAVKQPPRVVSFGTACVAGGLAGLAVDVALFPLDTIKTRLQSPAGLRASGGLRGIYRGLGAAAAGSAPGAALFFATYEQCKAVAIHDEESSTSAVTHMLAASVGEAVACLVRVPTEVIKAKMQTTVGGHYGSELTRLLETISLVRQETNGTYISQLLTGGMYRGYGITLFREIPFAMIQFPLYEYTKVQCVRHWHVDQTDVATPWEAAACGSASGAVAGGLTTPLDVLKTRLMIGMDRHGVPYRGVYQVYRKTVQEGGHAALLRGWQPRVLWIGLGGFVFFGAYETGQSLVSPILG